MKITEFNNKLISNPSPKQVKIVEEHQHIGGYKDIHYLNDGMTVFFEFDNEECVMVDKMKSEKEIVLSPKFILKELTCKIVFDYDDEYIDIYTTSKAENYLTITALDFLETVYNVVENSGDSDIVSMISIQMEFFEMKCPFLYKDLMEKNKNNEAYKN